MTAPAIGSESRVWSIDPSGTADETPLVSYRPAPEPESPESDLLIPEFLRQLTGARRPVSMATGSEAQVRAAGSARLSLVSRVLGNRSAQPYPSQQEAIQSLEHVRDQLDLTNDTFARLLGSSLRRYYEWRKGDRMPWGRIQMAVRAASVINTLLAEDPDTAIALFRDRCTEAADLIATQRYGTLGQLIAKVRAERAREQIAMNPAFQVPITIPAGVEPAAVLASIKTPEAQAFMSILGRLMPLSSLGQEVWKAERFVEMEIALAAMPEGDPVEPQWLFAAGLGATARDELSQRVGLFLMDPTHSAEAWVQFLESERRAVVAHDSYEARPPVDETVATEEDERPWARYFDLDRIDDQLAAREP
jgi:hypothetical protein